MTDRHAALLRNLTARLGSCSFDELRVLDVQLVGMEQGRDAYGPLDLSKPRDWELEVAQEHRDAAFYRACAVLVERDRRVAEIERDLQDESATGELERIPMAELAVEIGGGARAVSVFDAPYRTACAAPVSLGGEVVTMVFGGVAPVDEPSVEHGLRELRDTPVVSRAPAVTITGFDVSDEDSPEPRNSRDVEVSR